MYILKKSYNEMVVWDNNQDKMYFYGNGNYDLPTLHCNLNGPIIIDILETRIVKTYFCDKNNTSPENKRLIFLIKKDLYHGL